MAAAVLLAFGATAQDSTRVFPAPTRSVEEIRAVASEFTFVRIQYTDSAEIRRGLTVVDGQSLAGGAWLTDYPEAEYFFSKQVEAHLGLSIDSQGVFLNLTDPKLSEYPFIYLVEGGRFVLSDDEVSALRDYLDGGGFLVVDDFWGRAEWTALAGQLERVFPEREPVRLWGDHEIFWSFYPVNDMQSVPGIAEFTSPRPNADPDSPVYRGILADDGRVMAILLHNMDFGDAWEHLDDPRYPPEAAIGAVAMGINLVAYALLH